MSSFFPMMLNVKINIWDITICPQGHTSLFPTTIIFYSYFDMGVTEILRYQPYTTQHNNVIEHNDIVCNGHSDNYAPIIVSLLNTSRQITLYAARD
jgi:hypothetical protein